MTITVDSTSKDLWEAWQTAKAGADRTIADVGHVLEEATAKVDIRVHVRELENYAETLDCVYTFAVERIQTEDRFLCCSKRSLYTTASKVLDTGVQFIALGLWLKTLFSNSQQGGIAIATTTVTVVSAVVSKFKVIGLVRYTNLQQQMVLLEEIIPNGLYIKHVQGMVEIFRSYQSLEAGTPVALKYTRIPQEFQRCVSQRALCRPQQRRPRENLTPETSSENVTPAPEFVPEREFKREEYVVRRGCYGIYPILDADKVGELEDALVRLQKQIKGRMHLLGETLEQEGACDMSISIHQLDDDVNALRELFAKVDGIIDSYKELQKERSVYVTAKFRVGVQALLEVLSVGSSIVDAVSANVSAGDSWAKIAGAVFYISNVAVSWVSNFFEQWALDGTTVYQQVSRLKGQEEFTKQVREMQAILLGYHRLATKEGAHLHERDFATVLHAEIPMSFRRVIKQEDFHTAMVQGKMEECPRVATPGSALASEIRKLWAQRQARAADLDGARWREYTGEPVLRNHSMARRSAPVEPSMVEGRRRLSLDDVLCLGESGEDEEVASAPPLTLPERARIGNEPISNPS